MSDRPSFRDELEHLEAVVRELERDDVDLDRALVLFEDGVRRLRRARELLGETERKVRQVLDEAGETVGDDDAAG